MGGQSVIIWCTGGQSGWKDECAQQKRTKRKDYPLQHSLMYVCAHHSDVAMAAFALHQKCMQDNPYDCLYILPADAECLN